MSSTVVIPDNVQLYSLDSFVIPSFYRDDLDGVLIPAGFLRDRTKRMAQEIAEYYGTDSFIAVGILTGCYRFYYELLEELKNYQQCPIRSEFVRIKSYVNTDSKDVTVVTDDVAFRSFKGKRLLVVEDIVDTGKSLSKLLEILNSKEEYRPEEVKIAVLTAKRTDRNECGLAPDFAGFSVPDRFIVGCAFDYNKRYRDLPHVCLLKDEARVKYADK